MEYRIQSGNEEGKFKLQKCLARINETIPASSFVTQVAARDDTGENSRLSFLPVNFATVETKI